MSGPYGEQAPVDSPRATDVSFHRVGDHNGEASSQARSHSSGSKGKEREERGSYDGPTIRKERPARDRTSGGFLLETSLPNGAPHGTSSGVGDKRRSAPNGPLYVDKRRRHAGARMSAESSLGSSPLSREVSMDGAMNEDRPQSAPGLDPAQLVQMALDLSESRRRHVSGPLRVPLSPKDSRRSSARQRISYMANDSSRVPSGQLHEPLSVADDGIRMATETQLKPSPATLSRAEKARKYFELASEHRRLLHHLPPLKPDSTAKGNHSISTANSPGSTYPEITRTPTHAGATHDLGRPYNPLQALRNRRLRNRERQVLPAPPEAWQDVDAIGRWIDEVEKATRHPLFRETRDTITLPRFHGDIRGSDTNQDAIKGHRRTDTASSVLTRPENGWSIEPCELLADTYWTEKGSNRYLLESSRGSPVFPRHARHSVEKVRVSQDGHGESPATPQGNRDDADHVPFHKRAHRATHLLPRRTRPSRLARSGSNSSVSSDGRPTPMPLRPEDDSTGILNIGPLEKHMRQMIARDERGELTSPELVSPDHWDSKHTVFPILHSEAGRPRRESVARANGRLSVGPVPSHHRRAKSADGRMDGRVSTEILELSHADSLSPVAPGSASPREAGLSFTTKRNEHSKRLHRLPLFRADSRDRPSDQTERMDFANGADHLHRDIPQPEPRSSQESTRPLGVQRHVTADSTHSLRRQGTSTTASGSSREPGSAVGRFFKGGRIGEMVRSEGARFSDRFRNKDRMDDVLPVSEESALSHGSDDETAAGEAVDVDPSPRTSIDQRRSRPRYNLQHLPSFKHPLGRNSANLAPPTRDGDPITRQQRAQREAGRSPRFDRLAPPRINLPADEESPLSTTRSGVFGDYDRRKSYGFLGARSRDGSHTSLGTPGEMHPNNHLAPTTGLTKLQSDSRHRHWSISDRMPQPEEVNHRMTMRDVARVKALLLSSGVKARELLRQADSPRAKPLPLYHNVAAFLEIPMTDVPLREEHVIASRKLADYLSSSLSAFDSSIRSFEHGPAKEIDDRLSALQRRAMDDLTSTVQNTSDEADAFNVELTTKAPQDVKRVDDAIDDILRERRRQWRLLRRTGFKLLEWLVLGIMWWVWFVVMIFKTFQRAFIALLRVVKWLLWF
ncbi:hypothetical protein BAUCODRAFT_565358 [Baudoinia panamericana UAMH 10762]|uniref:Uncharacterized protein n=1 Tax=Baudoinia panamericana (strain UAMH 10762) TaxID=717646 RepID=M2MTL1_BAUPA|nr:uncharacterized protein BAUCODRAFT_565358 [Baudoinia panamericana UAMH 10762]EMC94873.1 hypothetical protein BAUCODRAFT_565358 [Baudoinia panamericana UAMH 10762]